VTGGRCEFGPARAVAAAQSFATGAGRLNASPAGAVAEMRLIPVSLVAISLAASGRSAHDPGMFVVSEAEAAAIRAAFDRGGEFTAAIELRRLFPGIPDNDRARDCARTIAAWKPLRMPRKARTRSSTR
jgi:hypothetical protein